MGFFNEVGRTFEQVKQTVSGDEADTAYRCAACEASLDADHDHCPECGEAAVVAADDGD